MIIIPGVPFPPATEVPTAPLPPAPYPVPGLPALLAITAGPPQPSPNPATTPLAEGDEEPS